MTDQQTPQPDLKFWRPRGQAELLELKSQRTALHETRWYLHNQGMNAYIRRKWRRGAVMLQRDLTSVHKSF